MAHAETAGHGGGAGTYVIMDESLSGLLVLPLCHLSLWSLHCPRGMRSGLGKLLLGRSGSGYSAVAHGGNPALLSSAELEDCAGACKRGWVLRPSVS